MMEYVEQFVVWLQQLPPFAVLSLIFIIAYIENVFPPSPSDMIIVFAGTLVGIGTIGFVPSLIFATAGSTLGFMTAYGLGRYFESHIIEGRMGRYLPVGAIQQVEKLFKRFGYGVIIANRFLAGTRAIVSIFAGMSKMNLPATTALSAVSAAVWNSLLLYFGMAFANNWRVAAEYVATYSKVVTMIVLVALAIIVWWYLKKKRPTPRSD